MLDLLQTVNDWRFSNVRQEMLEGHKYYIGDHDILKHRRMVIGEDGDLIPVKNLANKKILDNLYAKHVDHKTNYLLGQPITFVSDNSEYAKKVSAILGYKFMRTLKQAGTECFNSGIAWLYPFYNDQNILEFRLFCGHEILPFWLDSTHDNLQSAARLYSVQQGSKIIDKIEYFTKNGVSTYLLKDGHLITDGPARPYVSIDCKPYNWQRFPLIPIRYSSREIPLIRKVKSLQDAVNLLESNFVNVMQDESGGGSIIVLKNYDGQNLAEFRKNISEYRAIKVRTVDGADGGVETLSIEVNAGNYQIILAHLKQALVENIRSFDTSNDKMGGTLNQLNIQSLYCDIELDALSMQTELNVAFEDIFWFVNTYLNSIGAGNYFGENIKVVFNRDILINETESIENCAKSVGIISDSTIISMHPWVDNPAEEIVRMKEQQKEQSSMI